MSQLVEPPQYDIASRGWHVHLFVDDAENLKFGSGKLVMHSDAVANLHNEAKRAAMDTSLAQARRRVIENNRRRWRGRIVIA